MKRKKHSAQTWFDMFFHRLFVFLFVAFPFALFALFLNLYINQIRGWIHYSAIESVLKKEGIECEGKIISWTLHGGLNGNDIPGVTKKEELGERYNMYKWRTPTVEFLDQHGNKHTFESLWLRNWHPIIVNVSIPITFAQNNPSIALDNEARTQLAWHYPIFFIVFGVGVIFGGACFVGAVIYCRAIYESGLPKAERKRRRRERKLRQREREQRDNVS